MNTFTQSLSANVLVVSLGLSTSTAMAADPPAANAELESIVITSVRQAYRGDVPTNELPQNVTIIDEQIIKDIHATQLDTVLDLSSGVSRQNTFGGLWDSFAIRGFAGDENTPSGYLVNGFSGGRGFGGRRDTSNVQSIEILKGPGSALYGRGEPGGTINIVTKKPSFDPSGSVALSLGSFSTKRFEGDGTGPIGNNTALRVNGSYTDAKSFRDFMYSKKLSLTPSIFHRFGDNTGINYELDYIKQEAPFDRGVVAVNNVLGLIPSSRFLGEPADGAITIKGLGHQITFDHRFNTNWAMLAGVNYRTSSFEGFSSEPELVNGRQLLFVTPDAGNLTRQRRYRDFKATDKSLRFELSGKVETGVITHHVLIGGDGYNFTSDQIQLRYRPTLATALQYAINIYNPVYGATPGAMATPPLTDLIEKQKAYGLYVQDQIDLTDHWKTLIGARYDHFSQDFTNHAGTPSPGQSGSQTSPRLGLVYEFNSRNSIYTSFSRGYRPNTGTDAYNLPFAPETSNSVEVGSKFAVLDDRLSGSVAVYRGKKSNFLTADPVNIGKSIAAGAAQSDGAELDFNFKMTDNTTAVFSYAYTHARTTKDLRDVNFGFPIPAGTELINIPKQSAHVLVNHKVYLNSGTLTFGGDVGYTGDRLGETGYQPEFRLPAYTLLNLMAAYNPTENLTLSLHINNVLDKTYYPSSYSRFWVAPGTPRAYTVTIGYKL